MDAIELNQRLNGKSFRLDESNVIYTFVINTNEIDISGTDDINSSHYSILRHGEGNISINLEFHNESLLFLILSSYHEPFKIRLWGMDSGKYFGTLTEITQ